MSSVLDGSERDERSGAHAALPPIGVWWPMLEGTLQREILENPSAPLRALVVRRIFELCELDGRPLPHGRMRLGPNERAYLAGWTHATHWS